MAPYRAQIQAWVAEGIDGTTIHRALVRNHGFTGSYSAVRRFLQYLPNDQAKATIILDFAPSEAAQVDFGSGPKLIDLHRSGAGNLDKPGSFDSQQQIQISRITHWPDEMIGLKRHTVRLVGHHPDWADMAANACLLVRDAGGELIADVQHIGSTAVPGLSAKPILDLAVSVSSLDVIPALIGKLTKIGYFYRGDGAGNGGHLFVWESEPNVRTIHLHVVALDDVQWQNYLQYRNLLCKDPNLRKRYEELKNELQVRFPDDRKTYSNFKNDFIREVLSKQDVTIKLSKLPGWGGLGKLKTCIATSCTPIAEIDNNLLKW
ncbi:MAG: GrpB family protein [Desulfomonilaceae bacterium]